MRRRLLLLLGPEVLTIRWWMKKLQFLDFCRVLVSERSTIVGFVKLQLTLENG